MSDDPLGDLAHIITGSIANSCCFITGGHNANPRCECRAVAQQLIDYADEAIDAINRARAEPSEPCHDAEFGCQP